MPTLQPSISDSQPPLTWEPSSGDRNASILRSLPEEVVACLNSTRFLHLATCTNNQPHVSLMNYTYIPPSSHPRLPAGPSIVMTSNPSSKKTVNLQQNPNVSLLVHDWVSSRPPATTRNSGREASPSSGRASSLANMLMQMNSAAVSSISATMNGEATVLEPGTEEDKWCREQHLANNTFEPSDVAQRRQQRALSSPNIFGTSPSDGTAGDGGRESYIEDEDVRVVVVRIRDGRISDWEGGVKDWVISEAATEEEGAAPLVNGGS